MQDWTIGRAEFEISIKKEQILELQFQIENLYAEISELKEIIEKQSNSISNMSEYEFEKSGNHFRKMIERSQTV